MFVTLHELDFDSWWQIALHNYSEFFACMYRIVKLTSPKLNYVIVAGALWIYINLYFAVFPNIEDHPFAYEVLCNVRILTL